MVDSTLEVCGRKEHREASEKVLQGSNTQAKDQGAWVCIRFDG